MVGILGFFIVDLIGVSSLIVFGLMISELFDVGLKMLRDGKADEAEDIDNPHYLLSPISPNAR